VELGPFEKITFLPPDPRAVQTAAVQTVAAQTAAAATAACEIFIKRGQKWML